MTWLGDFVVVMRKQKVLPDSSQHIHGCDRALRVNREHHMSKLRSHKIENSKIIWADTNMSSHGEISNSILCLKQYGKGHYYARPYPPVWRSICSWSVDSIMAEHSMCLGQQIFIKKKSKTRRRNENNKNLDERVQWKSSWTLTLKINEKNTINHK